MPTLTIEYATDAERLMLEQAVAFFAELRTVAHTAPHGTVIDAREALALTGGRQLLRDSLGHAVQARIDAADREKKRPVRGTKGLVPATS